MMNNKCQTGYPSIDTGYPSIDKPWLKYYKPSAFDRAMNTPKDKTIYRYYVENVFTKPDFPILKYFNTTYTTKQFLELIEIWAKAFCAIGVHEDEMVPVYGTWTPEIAAIFFALNAIGAHAYYEKLDITVDALRTETAGAKVAVVFIPLWNETSKAVFSEDRFKKIFVVGLDDSMQFPLNRLVKLKYRSIKKEFCDSKKYIFANQVRSIALNYDKSFEVPFKKGRIAVITTSSGTTSSVVKGIMDTNEGALSNVLGTAYSEPGFIAGKECLITLPPTASTAINCFYLLPLCMGMTVRIDPRADEESWPRLLMKYKPSLAATTGSLWYSFYRRMAWLQNKGKRIDLSFLDTFILGGSGVTPEQLDFINTIAKSCHVKCAMDAGYGCSEFFGVITVDKHGVEHKSIINDVIDVGIPIAGATVSIFDANGHELRYGQRGEIWAKGPSIMHGYFGKPDTTKQAFYNEWLKTGDIGIMDDDGFIYCYGRKNSSVIADGKTVYLFDIAIGLRKAFSLEDCMVEVKKLQDGYHSIVVYYVLKDHSQMKIPSLCTEMTAYAKENGLVIDGFREFKEAFPISPTTLKPQTRYTDGFFNYLPNGKRISIKYCLTENVDIWKIEKTIIEE